jgi:membrane protease YdiL (CAAX protease family)
LTGVYLGVIYQASGNLYIVMIIHALYDFIALVYLVRKGKSENIGLRAMSDIKEN